MRQTASLVDDSTDETESVLRDVTVRSRWSSPTQREAAPSGATDAADIDRNGGNDEGYHYSTAGVDRRQSHISRMESAGFDDQFEYRILTRRASIPLRVRPETVRESEDVPSPQDSDAKEQDRIGAQMELLAGLDQNRGTQVASDPPSAVPTFLPESKTTAPGVTDHGGESTPSQLRTASWHRPFRTVTESTDTPQRAEGDGNTGEQRDERPESMPPAADESPRDTETDQVTRSTSQDRSDETGWIGTDEMMPTIGQSRVSTRESNHTKERSPPTPIDGGSGTDSSTSSRTNAGTGTYRLGVAGGESTSFVSIDERRSQSHNVGASGLAVRHERTRRITDTVGQRVGRTLDRSDGAGSTPGFRTQSTGSMSGDVRTNELFQPSTAPGKREPPSMPVARNDIEDRESATPGGPEGTISTGGQRESSTPGDLERTTTPGGREMSTTPGEPKRLLVSTAGEREMIAPLLDAQYRTVESADKSVVNGSTGSSSSNVAGLDPDNARWTGHNAEPPSLGAVSGNQSIQSGDGRIAAAQRIAADASVDNSVRSDGRVDRNSTDQRRSFSLRGQDESGVRGTGIASTPDRNESGSSVGSVWQGSSDSTDVRASSTTVKDPVPTRSTTDRGTSRLEFGIVRRQRPIANLTDDAPALRSGPGRSQSLPTTGGRSPHPDQLRSSTGSDTASAATTPQRDIGTVGSAEPWTDETMRRDPDRSVPDIGFDRFGSDVGSSRRLATREAGVDRFDQQGALASTVANTETDRAPNDAHTTDQRRGTGAVVAGVTSRSRDGRSTVPAAGTEGGSSGGSNDRLEQSERHPKSERSRRFTVRQGNSGLHQRSDGHLTSGSTESARWSGILDPIGWHGSTVSTNRNASSGSTADSMPADEERSASSSEVAGTTPGTDDSSMATGVSRSTWSSQHGGDDVEADRALGSIGDAGTSRTRRHAKDVTENVSSVDGVASTMVDADSRWPTAGNSNGGAGRRSVSISDRAETGQQAVSANTRGRNPSSSRAEPPSTSTGSRLRQSRWRFGATVTDRDEDPGSLSVRKAATDSRPARETMTDSRSEREAASTASGDLTRFVVDRHRLNSSTGTISTDAASTTETTGPAVTTKPTPGSTHRRALRTTFRSTDRRHSQRLRNIAVTRESGQMSSTRRFTDQEGGESRTDSRGDDGVGDPGTLTAGSRPDRGRASRGLDPATTGSDDREEAVTPKSQPVGGSAIPVRGENSLSTPTSRAHGGLEQTVLSRTRRPATASDTAGQSAAVDGAAVANEAGSADKSAINTKSEIVRYNTNGGKKKNTAESTDHSPQMVYRTPTLVAPEAQHEQATERHTRGADPTDSGTRQSISNDAIGGTDRRMAREPDEMDSSSSDPTARRKRRLHQAGSDGDRSSDVIDRSPPDRSSGGRTRSPPSDGRRPSMDTPGPDNDGPSTRSESTRQRTVRGPQDVAIPLDGLHYEADVDRVVERLYRKLERKRRIERERRGQR